MTSRILRLRNLENKILYLIEEGLHMAQNPMNPFDNDMNDIFNQLMGGMNGFNSDNRRYLINGREVTPEEFAEYRRTGQLPGGANPQQGGQPGPQPNAGKDSILHKLGRNLTQEAREHELDPVIGRNKEIQETAEILSRRTKNNPVLVGDAGVGKTELAKQLALDMFGSKDDIIRLDMSEYSDRTAVSKMIGATAGYVGYEDNGNTLTEKVRRHPYSIILLDEIEKANPQVITLLLQVLDDGRLTDGQGNTIDFKNTVIIATSNAGYSNDAPVKMGRNEDEEDLIKKLTTYFRPEFLNRFNAIVEFHSLTKEDLKQIVDLMLAEVNRTLAKKGMDVKVTDTAKQYLIDEGYDEAMGARPLRRVIEREIRDKVTDYYLDHLDAKNLVAEMKDGQLVIVDAKDASKDDSKEYTSPSEKKDEEKDDKKEEDKKSDEDKKDEK